MMILAALAVVTATFQPPEPKVGDLITVEFAAPVRLEPSESYEIVAQQGTRAVVRTFEPEPFRLSGVAGDVRFRNLEIPVASVLKEKDDLAPAPFVAPRAMPYPPLPFAAIGIAALAALLAWGSLWWIVRSRRVALPAPPLAPDEQFRRSVLAIRERRVPHRWAALADATRRYLASTRAELRDDLTTSEILPLLRPDEAIVAVILRQGDLEKFSTRGAEPRDFDAIAESALALAWPAEPEEPAA